MNWRSLHEACLRGDRSAARSLYDAAAAPVFRQCLLASRGDHDAAKDLAQEVWVRLFKQLRQLKRPEAFVSWALSTCTTLACSRGRLEHRRAELLTSFATEASLESPLEGEADRQRREQLVRDCLATIEPAAHRAIARAVYVEGMTTRAAAEELGVPHGTVTVTLQRLRAKLRAALLLDLVNHGDELGGVGC